MQFSQDCVDLVKKFEGCRLTAYPDPATGGDPWTVFYGHTGPEVVRGYSGTQEQADAQLYKDLTYFCDRVNLMLTREPSQGEIDSMTSFAFNCGLNNLRFSTLLRKFNLGDTTAADEFGKWVHAAGKVMPGLVTRREAEADLYRGK